MEVPQRNSLLINGKERCFGNVANNPRNKERKTMSSFGFNVVPSQMHIQEIPSIFDTFKLNAANNNCSLSTCRLQAGASEFFPRT